MALLLFILIISFFFPVLIIPISIFIGLFIIFIPFKFTIDSLFNLFVVPGQIYQIATNPDLRRNHAIEHATVNVLEKVYGYKNLAGYATNNGFYIMGVNDTFRVKEAAKKGLTQMKKGNKKLAIHKKCGTSLIAANFISAIIFLFLLFYSGIFSIMNMIIAILLAHIIGPYLGKIVQQYFTTTPDVTEIEIKSASYDTKNYWNKPVKIFVKTEKIPYLK